jgi:hypothetical protein
LRLSYSFWLQRINNEEKIGAFIQLWARLQEVNLSKSGQYSDSSAYVTQFYGRVNQTELHNAWSTVEQNVKFF